MHVLIANWALNHSFVAHHILIFWWYIDSVLVYAHGSGFVVPDIGSLYVMPSLGGLVRVLFRGGGGCSWGHSMNFLPLIGGIFYTLNLSLYIKSNC